MASGRVIGGGNALYLYTLTNYATTPTIGTTPLTGTPLVFTRKTNLQRDKSTARWSLDLDQIKMDSDLTTMLDTYTSPTAPAVEENKFEDGSSEPGYPGNINLFALVVGGVDSWAGSPSYGKRLAFGFGCVINNDSGSQSWEYGKFVMPKFSLEGIALYGTLAIGGTTYFPAAYFTTPVTITIAPSSNRFGKAFYV